MRNIKLVLICFVIAISSINLEAKKCCTNEGSSTPNPTTIKPIVSAKGGRIVAVGNYPKTLRNNDSADIVFTAEGEIEKWEFTIFGQNIESRTETYAETSLTKTFKFTPSVYKIVKGICNIEAKILPTDERSDPIQLSILVTDPRSTAKIAGWTVESSHSKQTIATGQNFKVKFRISSQGGLSVTVKKWEIKLIKDDKEIRTLREDSQLKEIEITNKLETLTNSAEEYDIKATVVVSINESEDTDSAISHITIVQKPTVEIESEHKDALYFTLGVTGIGKIKLSNITDNSEVSFSPNTLKLEDMDILAKFDWNFKRQKDADSAWNKIGRFEISGEELIQIKALPYVSIPDTTIQITFKQKGDLSAYYSHSLAVKFDQIFEKGWNITRLLNETSDKEQSSFLRENTNIKKQAYLLKKSGSTFFIFFSGVPSDGALVSQTNLYIGTLNESLTLVDVKPVLTNISSLYSFHLEVDSQKNCLLVVSAATGGLSPLNITNFYHVTSNDAGTITRVQKALDDNIPSEFDVIKSTGSSVYLVNITTNKSVLIYDYSVSTGSITKNTQEQMTVPESAVNFTITSGGKPLFLTYSNQSLSLIEGFSGTIYTTIEKVVGVSGFITARYPVYTTNENNLVICYKKKITSPKVELVRYIANISEDKSVNEVKVDFASLIGAHKNNEQWFLFAIDSTKRVNLCENSNFKDISTSCYPVMNESLLLKSKNIGFDTTKIKSHKLFVENSYFYLLIDTEEINNFLLFRY